MVFPHWAHWVKIKIVEFLLFVDRNFICHLIINHRLAVYFCSFCPELINLGPTLKAWQCKLTSTVVVLGNTPVGEGEDMCSC